MLAGLSVTFLLCGQFEQIYVFEEKKKTWFCFASSSLLSAFQRVFCY